MTNSLPAVLRFTLRWGAPVVVLGAILPGCFLDRSFVLNTRAYELRATVRNLSDGRETTVEYGDTTLDPSVVAPLRYWYPEGVTDRDTAPVWFKRYLAQRSALLSELSSGAIWRGADAEQRLQALVGAPEREPLRSLVWVGQGGSFWLPGDDVKGLGGSLAQLIELEATQAVGGGSSRRVREEVARIQETLPDGVTLDVSIDNAVPIEAALREVLIAVLFALASVLAVIAFRLAVRSRPSRVEVEAS